MKLKQVLLEVISSMPVTSIDGVLTVSNTLSSLTSNPNEINVNAAVLISFTLVNFSNFLINFDLKKRLQRLIRQQS